MIDPGSLPGQTASLEFGEQTQMQRERKAIASAGRAQPGQPPPGAQPPQPPQGGAPQPGGQPTQPQPGVPQVMPSAPLQQPRALDSRINMQNLFQRQPTLQEPWRTWLRRQASRPGAGPEMQALAAAIDHQRGPLDQPPRT